MMGRLRAAGKDKGLRWRMRHLRRPSVFNGVHRMTIKFSVNRAGLRQLEREMARNIKKAVKKKLPAGVKVADGDAEKIARQVSKQIESAFKNVK